MSRHATVTPPLGRMVETAAGRVHLLRDGPRGAAPVVLLHGASGNLRDWVLSVMPGLARGQDVIAVDRPGFGHSSDPGPRGWTLEAQGRPLRAALAEIGVRQPVVLVGHSWSGALALDWALRAPAQVAGIVLLAGATMDWGGALDLEYRLAGVPVLGPLVSHAIGPLASERRVAQALRAVFAPQPVPPRYAAEIGIDLAVRPRTHRLNALSVLHLRPQILANMPRYGEIACPVEILHGTADRIVPAGVHSRPLAERLPDARLHLLDGVGHMPHHAAPGRVIEAVRAVLARAG